MILTRLNELAAPWAEGMLRACWQGALAAGIVWGLCRLLPRLPAATRALLWWLVCVKALLGLFTTGPLALAVLPAAPAPSAVLAHAQPVFVEEPAPAPRAALSKPVAPAPYLSASSVLLVLWLTGVGVLLALVGLERGMVRRLAAQARPCADTTRLRDIARAMGLASSPPILVSERAKSSLVMGLWRPKVVLCQADLARLTPSELRAVLAHELAHIRRKDLLAGVLPNLARLVFFFHPLIWLACREYELSREAACDSEALRVSGMTPADYGRLLLKLSLPSPPLTPTAGMVTLGVASPDSLLLRRRILGLRHRAGLPRGASGLVLLTTLVALSLHLTQGSAPAAISVVQKALPPTPAPVVSAGSPALTLPNLGFTKGTNTMSTRSIEPKPLTRPIGQKPTLSAALATASLALVTAPPLLAPPPSAAQTAPPAPIAPAVPVVPVAPEAPTAPVAPIAPIAPSIEATRYQYTLRIGGTYSTHTRESKIATAQRDLAKAQPGDCLVVDRDGKRYLITDAETLRKLQDSYAPLEALSKQMEAKGKEMELSNKPMEELGKQMEALGKQMEEKGKELEALGKQMENASDTERRAIQEKMRAVQQEMRVPADEMRQLGKKMREQGDKTRVPGNEMRALGQQMRVAAKEANERMVTLLDSAFKNNLAVEQKTP